MGELGEISMLMEEIANEIENIFGLKSDLIRKMLWSENSWKSSFRKSKNTYYFRQGKIELRIHRYSTTIRFHRRWPKGRRRDFYVATVTPYEEEAFLKWFVSFRSFEETNEQAFKSYRL